MHNRMPAAGPEIAQRVDWLPDLPSGTIAHIRYPLSVDGRPVRVARERVRRWARVLDVPEAVVEDLDLAVDELVVNATVHGAVPAWLRIAVAEGGTVLVLEVYDAGPPTPQLSAALASGGPDGGPETATALAEHGRGLDLVLGLAERVAVVSAPAGCPGKTVRVLFTIR